MKGGLRALYYEYFCPFPRLETERLVLRMVSRRDANELFNIYNRDESIKYTLSVKHKDLKYTKSFINYQFDLYKEKQCFFFVAAEKQSGEVVGTCSYVSVEMEYKVFEIGYTIAPGCWGKGYATEAAGALMRYAFNVMKAQRVYARVLPKNEASAKVLKKLGFEFEARLKKGYYFREVVSDIDLYGITDTMFKRVRFDEIKQNCEL